MRILLTLLFSALVSVAAFAQLQLTGSAGSNVTITVNATLTGVSNGAFAGSGFQPSPTSGQLDSDAWAISGFDDGSLTFGGTQTTGDFAQGSAVTAVSTGGIYGFDDGGDRFFGVQPTGPDFTPGVITLRMQNLTGGSITSLDVAYEIKVRNDQPRANSFNFSYSTDGITFTPEGALDYTSPEASTGGGVITVNRNTTIAPVSIANNDFFFIRWIGNDVSGSGNRDEFGLDDISVTINSVVVPVQLISFSALSRDQKTADLTWATATETNNAFFAIERSADGLNFTEIARLTGAGDSRQVRNYTFTDEKPLARTNYYRLRQIDTDGRFSFSPVASVAFGKTQGVRVFPSPAVNSVTVQFEEAAKENATWEVVDRTGRTLLNGTFEAETSSNTIDIAALPAGTYVVRVQTGAQAVVETFVKQ